MKMNQEMFKHSLAQKDEDTPQKKNGDIYS
jgi:hypothetical protein